MKKRAAAPATPRSRARRTPPAKSSGKRRRQSSAKKAAATPACDFDAFIKAAAAATGRASPTSRKPATPPLPVNASSPLFSSEKLPSSISDLAERASSQFDSLRKHIDAIHSKALKEIDGSEARTSKRCKIQKNACLQLIDEAAKDHKSISERIGEHLKLMKSSYMEIAMEAQASAARTCKVSIPELARSLEKSIQAMRSGCRLPAD